MNINRKPNIILIECDSMDGRVMGCAGHPLAATPHLDSMAEQGVVFQNTYSNSPQCCPARASRWSGRHVHEIGAWNNYQGMPCDDPTYLKDLEDAGYVTRVFGKTDYLTGGHSLRSRICAWTRGAGIRLPQKQAPNDPNRLVQIDDQRRRVHTDDWELVDKGIQWLQTSGRDDKPFFLNLSFHAPHPTYKSSRAWLDLIDPNRISLPPFESELHPVMEYMAATKNCLHEISTEDVLKIRHTYFAMVSEVDAMAGEVMKAVEDLNLDESTYTIFVSDHGDMNMEHRQYLKNSVYESSARVPLIIKGPDIKREQVCDIPVSLVDFYPTVMDMARISKAEWLSGHSLMPIAAGQSAARQEGVLSQYHSNFANSSIFMLRRGPWKYVAYPGYEAQLFHLDKDPEEMNNLAVSRPDVTARMESYLREAVDYQQVAIDVKAYDRGSFLAWRESLSPSDYQKAMTGIYPEWSDVHEASIQQWLQSS